MESSGGLEARCAEHPRRECGVPLGGEKAGDTHAGNRRPLGNLAQQRVDLVLRRPIRLGDELIGAIGVSGNCGMPQDQAVAEAALAAILAALEGGA